MADIDINKITIGILLPEISISYSKSSGPGGQHVNKVSTRVELRYDIPHSKLLSESQKRILLEKLKNKINKEGELIITVQEARSQLKNKEIAGDQLIATLRESLKPEKKRVATRPSIASREKRMEDKRMTAERKQQRKKPDTI
jgi:ribosome-associated protein